MAETMTSDEAYAAMYSFLEHYYSMTESDDIGNLLSFMSLLPSGKPADRAIIGDWEAAVKRAIEGRVDVSLRFMDE